MNIKDLDLTKLSIVFFVGSCALVSVLHGVNDIPELALGGLIGYLSRDPHIHVHNDDTKDIDDIGNCDNDDGGITP